MRSFVKWNLVVLAVAMSLAFATGAYADTLSWSFSDPDDLDVYGSGTMTIDKSTTYTSPETVLGSYYLVTDMTGNVHIDGTGRAILSFLSESDPDLLGTAGTDSSGNLHYDNLIDPSSPPYLDSFGIIFYIDGIDYPFELCGPSNCFNNNTTALLLDYNDAGDRDFHPVEITVETTAVPEPSVLALLTLGLVG